MITKDYKYDAFISYRHIKADMSFARDLLEKLESAGFRIAFDERDFDANASFLSEMERCVKESLFVLAVMSPSYLQSGNCEQEAVITKVLDMNERRRRLIPLIVEKVEMPVWMYGIVGIDFTAVESLVPPLEKLKRTLQMSNVTSSREDTPPKIYWNIPDVESIFSGRENVLKELHQVLSKTRRAALGGMGGMGKTRTAIEYAYRHRSEYHAVFWIRAETKSSIISGFIEIATLLKLREIDDYLKEEAAISKVQLWLSEHPGWLLVFDNVSDFSTIRDFIARCGDGYVLMTTRMQAIRGIAKPIKLDKMLTEEGALLLLRSAHRINEQAQLEKAKPSDLASALTISNELGGLPLALEHASAFIEENFLSPEDYLHLYRQEGKKIRAWHGELAEKEQPSVTITFSLAFESVAAMNAASADLLRLCAFLSPDAIPEEVLIEGYNSLGDNIKSVATNDFLRTEMIKAAARLSLLTRDPDAKTLSIHLLVQDVLRDGMDNETQRMWVERAVFALNRAFAERDYFQNWSQCWRLLPHLQACKKLIEGWRLGSMEAGQLMHKAGAFLWERARYAEAEEFLILAKEIRQKQPGKEYSDLARTLHQLADLYREEGKLKEAEQLYQRELSLWENVKEEDYRLDLSRCLHGLALLYRGWRSYEKAEPLFTRAIPIRLNLLGENDLHTAWLQGDLGEFYCSMQRYDEGRPLLERAIEVIKAAPNGGPEHPLVGLYLRDLGGYCKRDEPEEAEKLLAQAVEIQKKVYGSNHLHVAKTIYFFAELYQRERRYSEAEDAYLKALDIMSRSIPDNHHDYAMVLNSLTLYYHERRRFEDAEAGYKRVLQIRIELFGPSHISVATTLDNYARLLEETDRQTEAQELASRAAVIRSHCAPIRNS
jgi:tetratricopeptide (TPR) repeat protein